MNMSERERKESANQRHLCGAPNVVGGILEGGGTEWGASLWRSSVWSLVRMQRMNNPTDKNIDPTRLWRIFLQALGAEAREHLAVTGASGIEHPVQAIGVDDKHKRVIVVSAEHDARVAALMQGDVQATMPDTKVLVARPIAVDLPAMARRMFGQMENARISWPEIEASIKEFERVDGVKKDQLLNNSSFMQAILPATIALTNVRLPPITQMLSFLQQCSRLDWRQIISALTPNSEDQYISLDRVLRLDTMEIDRQFGVCPIPLYEFSEADWSLFGREHAVDGVQERLRELNIFQYFFPAADQLALGLVDNGLRSERDIQQVISSSKPLGHPLGDNELVPTLENVAELLDMLNERGYVATGEHGIEISPEGRVVRATLKYRPREGVISKLMRRIRLNANLSISGQDIIR